VKYNYGNGSLILGIYFLGEEAGTGDYAKVSFVWAPLLLGNRYIVFFKLLPKDPLILLRIIITFDSSLECHNITLNQAMVTFSKIIFHFIF